MYTILDITDQRLKEILAETCDHQPFIAKAKMVLIFCADYQNGMMPFRSLAVLPESLLQENFCWPFRMPPLRHKMQ